LKKKSPSTPRRYILSCSLSLSLSVLTTHKHTTQHTKHNTIGKTMTSSSKENVERLYKQREELEAEMASISQRLNGPNMPGVKGALVDNEGFPIGGGDLDLYSVRADRQRYNSLKNDHLKLTNMIEREVQALLSSSSNNRGGVEAAGGADTDTTTVNTKENIEQKAVESTIPKTEAAATTTTTTTTTTTNRKAFAVVDILAPGSPADTDGLMLHDRVLDFGGAFSISDAAALIQNNVGKSHRVVVNRAGMDEIVNITPRTWSGNGLLGAHFRALNF